LAVVLLLVLLVGRLLTGGVLGATLGIPPLMMMMMRWAQLCRETTPIR
jgi:hypothetical protein